MIGKTLAHYQITALLGKGGMGEVYRAHDSKLKRDVALKLLPEAMSADPARLERFQNEAQIVAGLNHPNIVTLHSVEEGEGQRFLTMELVQGRTLETLTASDALSLPRTLEIGEAVAGALAAAHAQGVIHRDLKPANVMLTEAGHVKVLDFGLAKLTDEAIEEDSKTRAMALTGEGAILGTVPYMSPEQLRGDGIDSRSDIFSFGVLLFEIATGQRPFQGGSGSEISSAILRDTPPQVTALKPDLPRHLGRIVARCLEKDPSRRYQTALDLRNDLEGLRKESESAVLSDQTSAASAGPPSAAPARRRTWLPLAMAAAALAAIALFVINREPETPTGPEDENPTTTAAATVGNSIAVLPFSNLNNDPDQEFFSDGLTEELLVALARIPDLQVAGRSSCFAFKGSSEALQTIGEKLNVAHILEGSVRRSANRVRISAQLSKVDDGFQLWSESYDRELDDIFEIQAEVARRVSEALAMELRPEQSDALAKLGTRNPAAHTAYLKGRFHWNQRTPEELRRAIDYLETAVELDPQYAQAHAGLAEALAVLPDYATDVDLDHIYEQVELAVATAVELDPSLGRVRATLGLVESYRRNLAEASRILEEIVEQYPRYASARQWHGWNLAYLRRFDEAIHQIREARELDPLSSIINSNVAQFLFFAGKPEEALEVVEACLEADPNFQVARFFRASILVELGRFEESLELQQAYLSERPDDPRLHARLAYSHVLQGELEEASRIIDDALRELPAPRHTMLALPLAAMGRLDEAFALIEEGCARGYRESRYVLIHPGWRYLGDDPRSSAVLECMGIQP